MITEKQKTGFHVLEITCDHCYDTILVQPVNDPVRLYFEYVYGPQLCRLCWKIMGTRIHELVKTEDENL